MIVHENVRPALPMPIKATPYRHQIEAFNFVCGLFGLLPGGDRDGPSDGEMPPVRSELPEADVYKRQVRQCRPLQGFSLLLKEISLRCRI